ncbi:MAG: type I-U CRISPR-associated protein Csb2 [Desulfomonilaceae bacterium]
MFSIGIHYLCGTAKATHPADRREPEWPPHPDRIFMALAAAYFETGKNQIERQALLWLESLGEPELYASGKQVRYSTGFWVPANDVDISTAASSKTLSVLPENRKRNTRFFPTAIPDNPFVYLTWPNESPANQIQIALGKLCSKVTCLGHSSSLVQMWLAKAPQKPNLRPDEDSPTLFLRVTGKGRLETLESRFKASLRPNQGLWRGYAQVKEDKPDKQIPGTIFDTDLIIFRKTKGIRVGLESTLKITSLLRQTMVKKFAESYTDVPAWLSGTNADGMDSRSPHVGYIPLADVGHSHADGHLLGVGMVFPAVLKTEIVDQMVHSLFNQDNEDSPQILRVDSADLIEWSLELERREDRPVALRPETWTGAWPGQTSRTWGTVTPIVLDRHAKGPNKLEQSQQTIADACERISLPRPLSVTVYSTSPFLGAPHARSIPNMVRKSDAGKCAHTHARIVFDSPVQGPILLGAGRYVGYGLCRPIR